jgi:hypothetical protein
VGACGHVIFFQTHATLAREAGGSSRRVASWQEYELGQIGAVGKRAIVLYHGDSPADRILSYGLNRILFAYRDLEDALDKIVEAIKDPGRFEPSPGGGGGMELEEGKAGAIDSILPADIPKNRTLGQKRARG